MKNNTLANFIRAECANLTSTNLCLDVFGKRLMDQDRCLVLRKRRCDYFKKSVLPLAKLNGCYDRVLKEYLKLDKSVSQDIEVKRCECGKELKPRERYCEICRKKRRQKTNRENLQKYRSST